MTTTTTAELELEAIELELLLDALHRRWGYDFRNYARASLRRRVRRAVDLSGAASMSSLQHTLLRDREAARQLVRELSVRTTAMFRDPEFYRSFREHVVPWLRTYPFVRIWNAGCASGEEAYSMAVLLEEEGLYDRARIYATDLSDDLLAEARSGVYPMHAVREWHELYARAGGRSSLDAHYVSDGERAIVRRELRRNVVFSQHDLASDRSFNEFNVILCRNVMIYFDEVLRERVHQLVYDSLARFGVLALGIRESLRDTSFRERYEPLDEAHRIYRRVL